VAYIRTTDCLIWDTPLPIKFHEFHFLDTPYGGPLIKGGLLLAHTVFSFGGAGGKVDGATLPTSFSFEEDLENGVATNTNQDTTMIDRNSSISKNTIAIAKSSLFYAA